MSENETKTENNFGEIENVGIEDLAKIEFPPVNKNAVEASMGANSPKPDKNISEGWNPDIHETPPRKNKRGEWAKKRGNKKGYIWGKTKNENPPPLKVPPNPEDVAAEMERAAEIERKLSEQTRAAAEMAANGVILAANAFSGYSPEDVFRTAYIDAWERYLNSFWRCKLAALGGSSTDDGNYCG